MASIITEIGSVPNESTTLDEHPLRVMSLHALLYCERLFYLEEVEEIRVADAAVYAGRRLHEEILPLDDESPERRSVEVVSEEWGLFGKVDAVRRRDGNWVAYEHKRGRCRRGDDGSVEAWPSDRIQAIAYAVLLEDNLGESVAEARVRYHADNVTAFVTIDDAARAELRATVSRARELRHTTSRPPVHENERMCVRCSLAPVCLPEEERLAERSRPRDADGSASQTATTASQNPSEETEVHRPRLFPATRQKQTLHVVSPRAYVSRSADMLVVTVEEDKQKVPIEDVDSVLIHGFGQITTQAIQLCAHRGVNVQWMTMGGQFIAGTSASPGRVQQRLRQYAALSDPDTRLRLTRQLVQAKVESQLRYLLLGTRGDPARRDRSRQSIEGIREALRRIPAAASADTLRGLEGTAARNYFAALPELLITSTPDRLRPDGRSKHPPRDRFNSLLSFGYALIHSLVHRSVLGVGLEPAFGFFHQPRTSAPPLVLDLMELFRTPLWEMVVVASVNRGQWSSDDDFAIAPAQVWLSEGGRKKAIALFEQRLQESYHHPHTGQALTYARMVELEVRLLEKEWTGCPGLFARWRMR
jgi:CRISPR-associated protein Cas1